MAKENPTELPLSFAELPIAELEPPADLSSDRIPLPDTQASSPQLPPIVSRNGSGWTVLDGCKRVRQASAAGRSRLLCGVVGQTLDPVAAGLLRVTLNCGRMLHHREKLLFVAWLKANLGPGEYAAHVARLPLGSGERHEFEELVSCNRWLVDAVLDGELDPIVAPEMNHLPNEDATAIITLFSSLKPSRQMQRELAEWLPEIAFDRKVTTGQVISSEELSSIISDARLNIPQRAARFHEAVHAIRFPLFSKLKESWSARGRKINPDPSHVNFQPSPYFEKNRLEIHIRAEDGALLRRTLGKLAEVEKAEWDRLIDPTRE